MPMISLYINKGHRFFKFLWPFLFYGKKSCQRAFPDTHLKGAEILRKDLFKKTLIRIKESEFK